MFADEAVRHVDTILGDGLGDRAVALLDGDVRPVVAFADEIMNRYMTRINFSRWGDMLVEAAGVSTAKATMDFPREAMPTREDVDAVLTAMEGRRRACR